MRHVKTILHLLLLGSLITGNLMAHEKTDKRTEIIDKFNSKNDPAIAEAYWLLVNNDMRVKPEYRDDLKIKDSLWNALKFLVPEPVMIKSPESEGNSTADYLLYIVGDVKEIRAIPYLLKNIHFSGFQDSLARMGDAAVSPVLEMLKSGNNTDKGYAINVLGEMLAPKPREIEVGYMDPVKGLSHKTIANSSYGLYEASGETRQKIKQALKAQLDIKSVGLKESVLWAYKYVADESDVKLLNEIVRNDAYVIRGTRLKNGQKYPIREVAQEALDYMTTAKSRAKTIKNDVHVSTATK